MPRYYCDYCDTHLTHDSANVRQYYQQFEELQTQSLIDQKVKEHLGQTTAAALAQQQVGGAVYSHLTSLGGQYKPIAAPGLLRPPALAIARPPVLAPPLGSSGYGNAAPPTFRPPVALPLGSAPTQYYSSNGPSQMQFSTSNGAPQYSANNSSLPQSYSSLGTQPQFTSGINSAPAQYQSPCGGSQEQHYSNGPARVSLPSTYNQGPVYQR